MADQVDTRGICCIPTRQRSIISPDWNAGKADEAYDASSDMGVLRQPGTILPRIIWRLAFWTLYAIFVEHMKGYHFHAPLFSLPSIVSFASVFIVFRLQSAYRHYCEGLVCVQEIVDAIRDMIGSTIAYMGMKSRATDSKDVTQANGWKVDIIRFSLLFGATVKMQTRLKYAAAFGHLNAQQKEFAEFDLMRARGLLRADEYEVVKKLIPVEGWTEYWSGCCCCRKATYRRKRIRRCGIANWALQQLRLRIAHITVAKHGPVERVLMTLNDDIGALQKHSTRMSQYATIPLPLDYMQMTKFLTILFQVLFPLEIPSRDGCFASIFFPIILSFIFCGMDVMCTDMEDPFGDDPSDLKVVTPLWDVEVETMQLLEDRSEDIQDCFAWHELPAEDDWLRPRYVARFLTLESERFAMEQIERRLRSSPDRSGFRLFGQNAHHAAELRLHVLDESSLTQLSHNMLLR